MKRLILLFLIMLTQNLLKSQPINLQWAKEDPTIEVSRIFYEDNNFIYSTGYCHIKNKSNLCLFKHDKNLNVVLNENIIPNEDNIFLEDVRFLNNNNILIITSQLSEKGKKRQILAKLIDTNFKIIMELVSLMTIIEGKNEDINYKISYSENYSNILLNVFQTKKDDDRIRLNYILFDNNLVKLTENVLEFNKKEFYPWSVVSNNYKEIFLLGAKSTKISSNKKNNDYNLTLIIKNLNNNNVSDAYIELGNKRASKFIFKTDENGDLHYISFYKDDDVFGYNGLIYFSLNHNNNTIKYNTSYPFTEEIATRLKVVQNDNFKKNEKPYIDYYHDFMGFIVFPEKFYVVLEKNAKVYHERPSGIEHVSESIIVFQFSQNGQLNWYSIIPKRQYVWDNNHFIGHTHFFKNNNLSIIYNDAISNADYTINSPKAPNKFINLNNMQLVLINLDNEGKTEKYIIGDNDKFGTNIMVRNCKLLMGNRLFLKGYKIAKGDNKIGIASF